MSVAAPELRLGIICTDAEWAFSQTNGTSLHCLTRGQSIGLTIRTESGFISLIAVLVVFALILRNVIRHALRAPRGSWSLLAEPSDIYMLSLFVFDFVQSLGRVMDLRWIKEGKLYTGPYCYATGSLQQIGETGSAMIALAITVHTFVTVWWGKGAHARRVAMIIVGLSWSYVVLFVIIGIGIDFHKPGGAYDQPSPYWCWMGDNSPMVDRIIGEYLWLWLAMLTAIILYVPMYFWARGNITISDDAWWKFSVHRRKGDIQRRSLGIIAYPVTYSLCILPLTIGRWWGFKHSEPSALLLSISSLFGLNGLFNVLLLFVRPDVLLFNSPSGKRTRSERGRGGRRGPSDRGRAPSASPSPSDTHGVEAKHAPSGSTGMGGVLPLDSDSEMGDVDAYDVAPVPHTSPGGMPMAQRSPDAFEPYAPVRGQRDSYSRSVGSGGLNDADSGHAGLEFPSRYAGR